MRTQFMFFHFIIILVLVHIVSGLNYEGEALISFMSKITESKPVKLSWNSSDRTPCYWQGIHCDHKRRVVSVNMSNYEVSGQLGEDIGQLKFLKKLDLSINSFSGKMPSGLGNCTQLKHLDFSTNSFTGKIPESLKNLIHLRFFSVNQNFLSGVVPDSLFQIPHLRYVSLGANSFSGSIPPSIGNLSEITLLKLDKNQFSGKIPYMIGNCTKLEELYLNDNNLVGTMPSSIKNLRSLVYLDASSNRLQGSFSLEMTELPQLRNISLYNNRFSGVIPQTLGVNSSLEHLDFTNNKFSGKIPPDLCFRNQLKVLHLGQNQFQYNIPSNVGSCPTLQRLILQQNNLTGVLPPFTKTQNLLFLDISRNNVSGTIPSSLVNCTNITSINLSMNKLRGSIPRELGGLLKLQKLDLSKNHLKGSLPPQLSKCKSLYSLDVGFNSLNGSIPSSLRTLKQLSTLILRENQFTGGIPDFLAELGMLLELQLGGNSLGGNIPPSLGELMQISYILNLSGNILTGTIPDTLNELSMLQVLDISFNNLTGSLNPLMGFYSLVELNISYNFFSGSIPGTLLKTFKSPSAYLGNPDLRFPCEFWDGLTSERNSKFWSCDSRPNDLQVLGRIQIVMIAIASSLSCIFLVLMSTYMIVGRKRREKFWHGLLPKTPTLSLKYVMEATDNLNDKFIIGKGSQGTVYKALPADGKPFAVKKIVFGDHKRAYRSMCTEINTARQIRQQNIVRLLGYLFEENYGLLMYKYMPNGSLHDLLHEICPAPDITWTVRYEIALGTAKGVAYLHNDCYPAVVHQDIKPKNILLDEDMEPCISDFGIAKFIDGSPASMHTMTVIGTLGYIAPEIAFTMVKNKASDVYSYGVVLLELLTRKKVIDLSYGRDMNIVEWVHSRWNSMEDSNAILDPSLLEGIVDSDAGKAMKKVLLIALQCTEKNPRKRPTMKNVVEQLEDARMPNQSMKSKRRHLEELEHKFSPTSLKDVLKATDNLNAEFIIGKRAHTTVYKVVFNADNQFAVKRFDFSKIGVEESMYRELQIVKNIRHRNLARVVCCWRQERHGLILYEYTLNGSLHDVLHGTNPSQYINWDVRYNIAVGTAEGLAYLHHDCNPPIVHQDINLKNILIDSDMEPHLFNIVNEDYDSDMVSDIYDFGTEEHIAPGITFAMMASDVYSYGVVLLELITRKKVVEPCFPENMNIVRWAHTMWDRTRVISSIIDPSLLVEEFKTSEVKEGIENVLVIALRCTEWESSKRPTMRDVVRHLKNIKTPTLLSARDRNKVVRYTKASGEASDHAVEDTADVPSGFDLFYPIPNHVKRNNGIVIREPNENSSLQCTAPNQVMDKGKGMAMEEFVS